MNLSSLNVGTSVPHSKPTIGVTGAVFPMGDIRARPAVFKIDFNFPRGAAQMSRSYVIVLPSFSESVLLSMSSPTGKRLQRKLGASFFAIGSMSEFNFVVGKR